MLSHLRAPPAQQVSKQAAVPKLSARTNRKHQSLQETHLCCLHLPRGCQCQLAGAGGSAVPQLPDAKGEPGGPTLPSPSSLAASRACKSGSGGHSSDPRADGMVRGCARGTGRQPQQSSSVERRSCLCRLTACTSVGNSERKMSLNGIKRALLKINK